MPAAAVGYSDYTVSPVPEVVREYIVELIGAMEDNDLPAMRRLYYGKWTELTKMFYNESEWPEVENSCSIWLKTRPAPTSSPYATRSSTFATLMSTGRPTFTIASRRGKTTARSLRRFSTRV